MLSKHYCNLLALFFLFIHLTADAQTSKPSLRFGVIADIQYADQPDHGTRYYRTSLQKLDSCVTNLNLEPLAFKKSRQEKRITLEWRHQQAPVGLAGKQSGEG